MNTVIEDRDRAMTARNAAAHLFADGRCKTCGCKLLVCDAFLCDDCIAKQNQALAAEQEQKRTAESEARRKKLLAPMAEMAPRYASVRFSNVEPRVAVANAVARGRGACGAAMVTLMGATGAGKTSLAAAMFADILERAVAGDAAAEALAATAMWTTATALAKARREHGLGLGDAPLVERAISASLLVIDDAGMEPTFDAVTQVICDRYDAERPTIVTTGYGRAKLTEKYGDGVFRRLTDRRTATVIVCDRAAKESA